MTGSVFFTFMSIWLLLIRNTNSEQISVAAPLPNLFVDIGSQLSYLVNMHATFQYSDKRQNLEIRISRANGLPLPAWISLNMAPVTTVSSLFLGTHVMPETVSVIGNYVYISTLYAGLIIADITSPVSPRIVGHLAINLIAEILVPFYDTGDYAILTSGSSVQIINVTMAPNISQGMSVTVSALNVDSANGDQQFAYSLANNYLYSIFNNVYGIVPNNFQVFNVSDPSNPTNVSGLTVGYFTVIYTFDNYVVLGGDVVISIMDVDDPSNISIVTTILSAPISSKFFSSRRNYLFVIGGVSVNENYFITYDISTISNPVEINTIFLLGPANAMTSNGDYIYLAMSIHINVITIINVANPSNPQIMQELTTTFTLDSFFLSNNYLLVAEYGSEVKILDAASRVITGTPTSSDRGLLLLNVTTSDNLGNSVSQQIGVNVGNIIVIPIANQVAYVGSTTTFILPSNTFDYPNSNFTYGARLIGGALLPSSISFDATTKTFTFKPISTDLNSYQIQVTADNRFGGVSSITFTLSIPDASLFPPIVLNVLSDRVANIGAPFSMQIPKNTFQERGGINMVVSASLAGGLALPHWLKWDSETATLLGTPTSFDTDAFTPRILQINILAMDTVGSIATSFKITIIGESFTATALKVFLSIAGSIGTVFGIWKERALIWNALNKKKYQGETETAIVGRIYVHNIDLDLEHLKDIEVYCNGKILPRVKPLPSGLEYKETKLQGTATGEQTGLFTIRIVDNEGYITEEFKLLIKKNADEADLPTTSQSSSIQIVTTKLHNLATRLFRKDNDDVEMGEITRI